jgi:hypothetical protein
MFAFISMYLICNDRASGCLFFVAYTFFMGHSRRTDDIRCSPLSHTLYILYRPTYTLPAITCRALLPFGCLARRSMRPSQRRFDITPRHGQFLTCCSLLAATNVQTRFVNLPSPQVLFATIPGTMLAWTFAPSTLYAFCRHRFAARVKTLLRLPVACVLRRVNLFSTSDYQRAFCHLPATGCSATLVRAGAVTRAPAALGGDETFGRSLLQVLHQERLQDDVVPRARAACAARWAGGWRQTLCTAFAACLSHPSMPSRIRSCIYHWFPAFSAELHCRWFAGCL